MKNKLEQLEQILQPFAVDSNMTGNNLLVFPKEFQEVHSYKIFGSNLLAIPASLIMEGDDEEFEKPFRFLSGQDELDTFESEFREDVPDEFIQIGNLYEVTEIVLLNKIRNTIHIFHVQDVFDSEWMKYKLEKEICTLDEFINALRPQTVSCFMNPSNYSEYDIFEIRNETEVFCKTTSTKYSDQENTWAAYFKIVDEAVAKGYEIHYAPQIVIEKLN
ncbi:MAG TPA: hypothetical protein VFQ56_02135 [Flavobacterium sp.]|nr:hypothetical protein [Flavobacterium sp.]